jgi:hypothetical protein
MKKIVLPLLLIFLFLGCENTSDENPLPVDTIEGKWVYPTPGSSTQISNTMYLFEDGIRYTYYCIDDDCESQYESFEAGDGNHIPGTNNYTFENDTLIIDLNFGNELVAPIRFECDGDKMYLEQTNPYYLLRLGSDCN